MSIKDGGIALIPTTKTDDCYSTTLDESDVTPLMLAHFSKDPRYIDLLLKAGADVNQKGFTRNECTINCCKEKC